MDADLPFATLTEIAGRIRRRELSPVEVLRAQLEQIDARDPALHAYVTVLRDRALAAARAAEAEIMAGTYRGPLHGVPVAVKDLCFTRGARTTCGSRVLADFVPDRDARVVRRLEEAGAVLVGKLSLTEFAMTGYARGVAPPVNPWDASRYPGMSSSGSAVAASAGMAFATIGTDTGGSIRFPAAACGVVGLKPTYGRVSRAGVFPLAASLDHVGPITRCVADAAAVLDVIAGHDPDDPTTLRAPAPACGASLAGGAKGIRIGVDEAYATTMTQPEVVDAFHTALKLLEGTGATIVEVTVPAVTEVLPAWPILCAAEALVGHAGLYPARAADYGVLFRSMLEWGASLSGATVAKAMIARAEWVGRFADVFERVDVLACPSAATVALPTSMVPPDAPFTPEIAPFMRFTAPTDFSGHPTLSLPFGEGALPDSVQLVGRHREEALLCRVGQAFEQVAGRARRPPLA
jgi:amidase